MVLGHGLCRLATQMVVVVVVAVMVVEKTGIRSVGAGVEEQEEGRGGGGGGEGGGEDGDQVSRCRGGRAGGREAAAGVRSRSKGGCSESQDRSVHLLMVGSELGQHVRDVLGDNLGE